MTRRPNVLIKSTGVTHAKARGIWGSVTRCGIEYDHTRAPLFDSRPPGIETEDDVDCMTCLTKDPA